MKSKGLISFCSATLNGIESTKRALFLFDTVVVPSATSAIEKQVEIFSEKHPFVKRYLRNHLVPVSQFGNDYADHVAELMHLFGKYHFKNWLQPYFEEEVGEFIDQKQAELSWYLSLRVDSIFFSQEIAHNLKIPAFVEDVELSYLKYPPESIKDALSEIALNGIFDQTLPDPSLLDWPVLVEILKETNFSNYRKKIWECMNKRTPLSNEYAENLKEFCRENLPGNINMEVSAIGLEAILSFIFPAFGPFKALHNVFKKHRKHRKYSWIGVVHKIEKLHQSSPADDGNIPGKGS